MNRIDWAGSPTRGVARKPLRAPRYRDGIALVLVLTLLPASLRGQGSDTQPVRFTFAWPDGFAGSVVSSRVRSKKGGNGPRDRSLGSTYSFRVEEQSDDLRIRFSEPTIRFGEGFDDLREHRQRSRSAFRRLVPDHPWNYALVRLFPCDRQGIERQCAELELESVSDPEDMKRVLERFLSDLVRKEKSVPRMGYRQLEIETLLVVVTEPDGLVPHECTTTRTVRGIGWVENEGEQAFEYTDSTRVTYSYP